MNEPFSRFAIGTVDGVTHYSDWVSHTELEEMFSVDGYIGKNVDGKEVYVDSAEEALEFMAEFLQINKKFETQTFNMEINGVKRKFNVVHIIWWQIEHSKNRPPLF